MTCWQIDRCGAVPLGRCSYTFFLWLIAIIGYVHDSAVCEIVEDKLSVQHSTCVCRLTQPGSVGQVETMIIPNAMVALAIFSPFSEW